MVRSTLRISTLAIFCLTTAPSLAQEQDTVAPPCPDELLAQAGHFYFYTMTYCPDGDAGFIGGYNTAQDEGCKSATECNAKSVPNFDVPENAIGYAATPKKGNWDDLIFISGAVGNVNTGRTRLTGYAPARHNIGRCVVKVNFGDEADPDYKYFRVAIYSGRRVVGGSNTGLTARFGFEIEQPSDSVTVLNATKVECPGPAVAGRICVKVDRDQGDLWLNDPAYGGKVFDVAVYK